MRTGSCGGVAAPGEAGAWPPQHCLPADLEKNRWEEGRVGEKGNVEERKREGVLQDSAFNCATCCSNNQPSLISNTS